MGSTEVNSWLTLASIIIALIGWLVAVINWLRKKTIQKDFNQLTQERMQFIELLDSYELFPYVSHFSFVYLDTAKRAKGNWFKGPKSKDIIGNLESTLRDANKYYSKMSATNKFTIEQKIQKAISYLPDVAAGTPDSNKKMLEQLDSIHKLLNAEADLIKKQRITRFTTSI